MANIKHINLLPCDGEVYYHGAVIEPNACDAFFRSLESDIPWQHDEIMMFGRRIVTARRVAWCADDDRPYKYSAVSKKPTPWTDPLRELKASVESLSGHGYNSCLLNFYRDGAEGMGWHSDNESSIVDASAIASVSLGAERIFHFRHKASAEKVSLVLEDGSLLIMKGETQRCWKHTLPKSRRVVEPRINLTFRQMW